MKMRGRLESRKEISPPLFRENTPSPSISTSFAPDFNERLIRRESSSTFIFFLPESPLFSGLYGPESRQAGSLSPTQGADDPIHHAIHLIGGAAGIAAVLPGYFSDEIRFLHLSRA